MRVLINFVKGFKAAAKAKKMVLFLLIINFIFSLILAVPMYNSLQDSLGRHKAGEAMAGGFDYLWWEEFRDENKGLEQTFGPSIIGKGAVLNNLETLVEMSFFELPPLVLALGILYIIAHTFLAGGILFVFSQEPPKFTLRRFFGGAGSYFPRLFLLMLVSWLFYLGVGILGSRGFNSILNDISKKTVSEVNPFYYGLLFSAITFLLLLFIQMVFDYARIKVVLEEKRYVLGAAFSAFGFVLRHPISTIGLYSLIFIFNAGITIGYVVLKELLPQTNPLEAAAAFLLQELFIFAIIWIRCWLYSSQLGLYRHMK
jgi:hypothetical protein